MRLAATRHPKMMKMVGVLVWKHRKHCDSDQVPDTSVHFVDSQVIEKYKLCCYLILHLGVPKNLSQTSVATHAIASTMAGEHLKIKSSYMCVNQLFVQAASNRGNVLPYRVPVWLLMVDGPLQDIEWSLLIVQHKLPARKGNDKADTKDAKASSTLKERQTEAFQSNLEP